MPAVTVRNVPEETRNTLAARAAARGQSLQEFLLQELVQMASRPTVDEFIAKARASAKAIGMHIDADTILDDLDTDRR